VSRQTLLIFNAHADRGHAWDVVNGLRATIERLGTASWAATEYPGHGTELAVKAAEDGFEVVAALGGDGTVHEVVNGLMACPAERRPLLAAVPIGSGNDFCANVGLPKDPEHAIVRAFQGDPTWIDLATISDNNGQREYWDNTISIGFGAAVAIYSYSIRRLRGFPMYLWAVTKTIFLQHHAPLMKLETDEETIERRILMVSLNNGPREGGGFLTSPSATIDDGILNYALIEDTSRAMMLRLIPEVMQGTHGRFDPVQLGQFRRLHLTSAQPIPVHTDGEIYADFNSTVTELNIEVLPKSLQVLV
jgi:diacylglycerol kinase (ATP)